MSPVAIGPTVVNVSIASGLSMPKMRAVRSATLLSGAASLRYTTSRNTMTAETARNVQRIPISTMKIQSSILRRKPNRPL